MNHALIKHMLQRLSHDRFVLRGFSQVEGVVLTFDDGPHELHTEKIVAVLKDRGIRAMFFVIGSELEKYPVLGKLLVNDGHILGNHSYEHRKMQGISLKSMHESIHRTDALILSLTGKKGQRYLRPPYGILSPALLGYAVWNGYRVVGWTKDSRDSFIGDPRDLLRFVTRLSLKNGDVLLFHEDYGHTVEALPRILDYFIEKGVKFVVPEIQRQRSMRHTLP